MLLARIQLHNFIESRRNVPELMVTLRRYRAVRVGGTWNPMEFLYQQVQKPRNLKVF